jgi:hypothetical protein
VTSLGECGGSQKGWEMGLTRSGPSHRAVMATADGHVEKLLWSGLWAVELGEDFHVLLLCPSGAGNTGDTTLYVQVHTPIWDADLCAALALVHAVLLCCPGLEEHSQAVFPRPSWLFFLTPMAQESSREKHPWWVGLASVEAPLR